MINRNSTEFNAGAEIEKPLTIEEASKFLDLKKSTIYKMTHRREIPFSKPHGKKIYFSKAELVRWMLGKPLKTRSQIKDDASNYVTQKKTGERKEKKKAPVEPARNSTESLKSREKPSGQQERNEDKLLRSLKKKKTGEKIISKLEKGKNLKQIATALKISHPTLKKYMGLLGINKQDYPKK